MPLPTLAAATRTSLLVVTQFRHNSKNIFLQSLFRRIRSQVPMRLQGEYRKIEEIKRTIYDKLRRRLAHQSGSCMTRTVDTEQFDRLLALWIDLQRAMHLREKHDIRPGGCTPWNCADKSVRDAWQALTHPKNVLALESLYYQLPEGPQMDMASKALLACRQRRDAEEAKA